MKLLLILSLLLTHNIVAQKYYLNGSHKPHSEFIEVVAVTPKVVSVKVLFQSSERCACEPVEVFKLNLCANGNYVGHPYRHDGKKITATVKDGQIKRLTVQTDEYGCCAMVEGIYLPKKKR